MKKMNYKVICNSNKVTENLKKDKQYIYKKLIEIIYKRREVACYEKSNTNR